MKATIMFERVLPVLALLMVSACGGAAVVGSAGGSGGSGSGGTSGDTSVPAAIKNNLAAVSYNGSTVQIQISGGDSTTPSGLITYDRAAVLDVPGFKAFKMQEDALDRLFVAVAATSPDGSVTAVAAGDGGLNNHYFAGGIYNRAGSFDPPTIGTGPGAGQVSYAGTYAGLTNVPAPRDGSADDVTLPISGSVDSSVIPKQPSRVSGDAYMTANFQDNVVSGSIYNRQLVDYAASLPTIVMAPTSITTDGTFVGTVEYEGKPGAGIGQFAGIFGGTNAQSVAGAVNLTEFSPDYENEEERGVFVLTQCGPSNPAPICSGVAP